MKNMKYIALAFVACMMAGCVKDVDFAGGGMFNESVVTASTTANGISLTSDMEEESVSGDIEEKGFILTRTVISGDWPQKTNTYTQTISLSPDKKFAYLLDEDLWPGMDLKVQPYIVERGHKFYGKEVKVAVNCNGVAPHITSVKYTYDDASHLTGQVIIEGDHLGQIDDFKEITCKTECKGEKTFSLLKSYEGKVVFAYECNYIGDMELTYTTSKQSATVPQKLSIRTATHDLQDNCDVPLGIPYKVKVKLGNEVMTDIGADFNNYDLSASADYYGDGETAIIFTGKTTGTADLFFNYNGKKVYFESTKVTPVSQWKLVDIISKEWFSPLAYTSKGAWDLDEEGSYSQDFVLGYYDVNKNKYTRYKDFSPASYSYRVYGATYYKPVVSGDDVYFAREFSYGGDFIRIWKYDYTNEKFVVWKDLKNITGVLFSIVGDVFYFMDPTYHGETNYLTSWNQSTGKITKQSFEHEDWWDNIGSSDTDVYFEIGYYPELYKSSLSRISVMEKVDFNRDETIKVYNTRVGIKNYVFNNRFYQCGMMRTLSLPDFKDAKYFGIPKINEWDSFTLMPIGNKMYSLDSSTSEVYEYIGK